MVGILNLYPHKVKAFRHLLPSDTDKTKNIATWALAQMERDLQGLLNVMWTDESHFSLHDDCNTQSSHIWARSNSHDYMTKLLYSPNVTWCVVTMSFILCPFFLEEHCLVFVWKTCTITVERHVTLLRDHLVPALQERHVLDVPVRRSCWKLSLKTEW